MRKGLPLIKDGLSLNLMTVLNVKRMIMTNNYQFISHYTTKNDYNTSFNELTQDIFDIDFTDWFEKGYSDDHFIRFSYVLEDQVIANACANIMHLLINNVSYKAVQIGTVMTDENHRNQGLSRKLIEKIIAFYENEVDFFYLFANDTVLDFYPKLEFNRLPDISFSLQASQLQTSFGNPYMLKRLNHTNPEQFSLIERLVKERHPLSSSIQILDNAHLLLFHLLIELDDIIYYAEEEDIIILFEIEGRDFHLYDIIANKPIDLETVLTRLIPKSIKTVHFYFEPDIEKLSIKREIVEVNDDVLFVKSALKPIPKSLYFPLTSRA